MKPNIVKLFPLFLQVIYTLDPIAGQTDTENFPQTYDIVQRFGETLENIRYSYDKNVTDLETYKLLRNVYDMSLDDFKLLLLDIINENPNNTCYRDLFYIILNIKKQWALQMIDSNGKPESGLLKQNFKWIGDFDECRSVYAPKNNLTNVGGFHGKYCLLKLKDNSTMAMAQMASAMLGLCLPETCNPSDFPNIQNITEKIWHLFPSLNETDAPALELTCKPNTRQITNAAIATICLMSIFTFLVLMGSVVTAIKYLVLPKSKSIFQYPTASNNVADVNSDQVKASYNDDEEQLLFTEGSRTKLSVIIEKCEPFFNCFCIFTNGSKLLNTDATEGQLLCIHGIRFLSMSWVIVCHTYAFTVVPVGSFADIGEKIDNFPFQVIVNGFYSVDSFFVLSGFLMAYLYFQAADEKEGKFPWLYFYIHRYLRLTPVYMIVLAYYTALYPLSGNGPFWADFDVDPNCKKNWWWNLLYINNFQGSVDQCMGWSWYLANDMQFFVISPIFLITLRRWPRIGFSILTLFLFGCWGASFFITYYYDLNVGVFSDVMGIMKDKTFFPRYQHLFDKVYTKPYTRIGPYLVGIALGYFMFKIKHKDFKINKVTLCLGWILSTAVGLTCVYGVYHRLPGVLASSFYNALTRTCFAVCLSWVIFVCLNKQGGAVDKILSFKLFIPLSRLTYSAYLIHLMVITWYSQSLKNTIAFSHSTVVIQFLGFILVAYAISLLVSLVFESPLIRLEKFVRSKFQS